jgi:hypothetical protein
MSDAIDPRWAALHGRSWTCASCGGRHKGLFDLACAKPDFWQGAETYLPNAAISESSNCLTEDFCIIDGEHFFVRAVLSIPLRGLPGQSFSYGVWSTLSKKNFERYAETFDSGEQDGLGPWFGWFSNRLKGYPDTLNMKCQVHPQFGRQRPWIELEQSEHPLAIEARDGITYERLFEIYAIEGHTPLVAVPSPSEIRAEE